MASISPSDCNDILKEFYAANGFHDAGYKKNPGFARCKKKHTPGKHYDFVVKYGYSPNHSRTPATALAKANTTQYEEFNVTTTDDYGAKDIDKKTLGQVVDEGAFVDELTDAMESLSQDLHNRLGTDLFLHRGAAKGQVGSVSGTTLTLKDPATASRFAVGEEIRSSEADGLSGSLQAGAATITGIDADAGTLETDTDWTTQIATLDADDFLFDDGDFGIGRAGFPDWIPDTTTGLSTAFYQATRTKDVQRLAGHRTTVSTGTDIVTAVRDLMAKMGKREASPNIAFLSHSVLSDIETQVGNQAYVEIAARGNRVEMGFEAIRIRGGGNVIDLLPDRSCDDDHIYVGNDEVLECIHLFDEPVDVDDIDGEPLARNTSTFSYDMRASSFANFVIKRPNEWGVLVLS